ncbi:LysM peptidoglycan-binding domain-containing protein [Anaerolineales bacterium HSG6]|nr:LysM peptidoglycan-binding domain-containing protein [Anaerolineales bacterium HSG6]
MSIIFSKLTVCLAGGLLFLLVSCQNTVVQPSPIPPHQTDVVDTGNVVDEPSPQTEPTATAVPVTAEPEIVASPTDTPEPTITPTVGPLAIPTLTDAPYAFHTVKAGQTLGYIASIYDTPIETLVKLNKLSGPNAIIQINQSLRIPLEDDIPLAPVDVRWPDSEVVYGPAYTDFDMPQFIQEQGGYLATYSERVDGQSLTGAEVVERVAERFSVGPRVLLAALEHYGQWVTNPNLTDTQIDYPLGYANPYSGNLYLMLGWTAKKINAGYYGYKRDGFWIYRLRDYNLALTSEGLNAGTVGMQGLLAVHSDMETWTEAMSNTGLMATYQTLFGDSAQYKIDILVPSNLTQPAMSLPWQKGDGFYFTAGPHIAYIDGSAWAAVDFGPPDVLGSCYFSDYPNTASADGQVVVARQGEVQLDLDQDGQIQTGWVLLYLHVVLDIDAPVSVGMNLNEGDVVGYASCEGGEANASHLHFARRYNGEWMDAGGPIPMELSGWVVQPSLAPYDGVLKKGDEERASCECWEDKKNFIVNED